LLTARGCDGLLAVLEALVADDAQESDGRAGGIRNVLSRCKEVRSFVRSRPIHGLVTSILSADAFAVRAIYFRKMPESNWSIRWHQDRVIPLRAGTSAEEVSAGGLASWSKKAGVPHARAPRSVLDSMLSMRLHLDEMDAENGALQVLPGSHRAVAEERPDITPYLCSASRGSALLMRPLLWHASSKITAANPRRVLHIEFADADLPGELEWHNRW
jgi:ectoine hydroxylase-related dioxygenase (phytanoyl-CoA dioxygenase family)